LFELWHGKIFATYAIGRRIVVAVILGIREGLVQGALMRGRSLFLFSSSYGVRFRERLRCKEIHKCIWTRLTAQSANPTLQVPPFQLRPTTLGIVYYSKHVRHPSESELADLPDRLLILGLNVHRPSIRGTLRVHCLVLIQLHWNVGLTGTHYHEAPESV
jgi:hypothetical protein